MNLSNILSIIALLFAVSFTAWIKVISARAFKSIDDKIKELRNDCAELDATVRQIEKDIVRLNEFEKGVEKDIKQVKADVVREAHIMNNHFETVHKKIDHIDEKLDKLRDSRR